jgi:hypothetical protein
MFFTFTAREIISFTPIPNLINHLPIFTPQPPFGLPPSQANFQSKETI